MEKRLFLAIVLSIVVLMAYSTLVSRFAPQQPLRPSVQPAPATSSRNSVTYQAATEVKPFSAEKISDFANKDLSLGVNLFGSGIKASKINSYNTALLQSNIGLLAEWQGAEFIIKNDTTGYLSIGYDDTTNGISLAKSYIFTENKYILEVDVEFINSSNINRYVKYSFNLGSIDEKIRKENPAEERYLELSISLPTKTLRNNFFRFNPKSIDDKIQWVGIRDRYFCSIVKPLQESSGIIKSTSAGLTSYFLEVPAFEVLPGQKIKHSYLIYIGPQNPETIAKLGSGAEATVNFGMFDSLSHILLGALRLLYKVSKNWGVAIILFSLLVFIVLSPLSLKSFSSMKKMQEVQPLIEELKIKYKDSPQKMHKEVLEIYREKKINPFGGCLPMLLQMPIFVALYQSMMRFIDLKGAGFLWMKDLSEPDRLLVFKQSFPIIGNELNLLPLIMIVTMLIQQKLTTTSALQTPETAKQQKLMSLFMAVFFGVIFYHMPAGLVLYWAFNSVLMLIFQTKIVMPKPQKA